MKRKFLEDLGLDKETVDSILDENSADIGKAKGELSTVQDQLKTVQSEITTLKGQVSDRDGQLETLKNSTGDVDGLKNQIATLQADNKTKDETHAAEIKQLKVDAAVESAITGMKGKNAKAIKALLDLTKAELADDGTIKGLSEQLEKLTKADDSKFLFDTEAKKTTVKGAKPGETGKEEPDGKVDTCKMSYDELAAYMEQNPNAEV